MPREANKYELFAFELYDAYRREFPEGSWKLTTWETISQESRDQWVLLAHSVWRDAPAPVPMILSCPSCNARHIDEGQFATQPHHTHACQKCGMCWRPAVVPTVGVQFLPGFKDTARCNLYIPTAGGVCTLPLGHGGECKP